MVGDEWTGADSLDHFPAMAEEAGIGPAEEITQELLDSLRTGSHPQSANHRLYEIASALLAERSKKPADPPPPGRFGERVRVFACQYSGLHRLSLERIADAIDQDAAHQLVECAQTAHDFDAERSDLYQKIEQLVEELRYVTEMLFDKEDGSGVEMCDVEVLEVAPFLKCLVEIFGGEERDVNQDANGGLRQLAELNGRKNACEEERMRLAGRVHELGRLVADLRRSQNEAIEACHDLSVAKEAAELRITELETAHREKIRDIAIEMELNIRAARNEGAVQERENIRKLALDAALYDENAYGRFEIVGGACLRRFLDRVCPQSSSGSNGLDMVGDDTSLEQLAAEWSDDGDDGDDGANGART